MYNCHILLASISPSCKSISTYSMLSHNVRPFNPHHFDNRWWWYIVLNKVCAVSKYFIRDEYIIFVFSSTASGDSPQTNLGEGFIIVRTVTFRSGLSFIHNQCSFLWNQNTIRSERARVVKHWNLHCYNNIHLSFSLHYLSLHPCFGNSENTRTNLNGAVTSLVSS